MKANGLNPLHHRCGTCGEIFLSLEELCAHTQAHTHAGRYPAQRQTTWELRPVSNHGFEQLSYACAVCGEIFLTAKALGAHTQAHALPHRMQR